MDSPRKDRLMACTIVPLAGLATLLCGSCGDGSDVVQPANQTPQPLAAAQPLSGPVPLSVVFDARGSRDPDGSISRYAWTFGDGAASSSTSPSYTYPSVGTYVAVLTVTDDRGAAASDSITITVTSDLRALPRVYPTSGNAPMVARFDATEATGSIATYAWDFGDGGSSDAQRTVHVFEAPGTYEARLAVSDGSRTDTAGVAVTITSPSATQAPLPRQIIIDPDDPAWLARADGSPFFACGPGDPEGFLFRGSRNADGTRNGDQQALIDALLPTGANTIYVMASRWPGGDGGPTENPFVGNDPDRPLDPVVLDQWSEWLETLDRAGIVTFFFFYDDERNLDHPSWRTGDSVGLVERAYLEGLVNRFEHLENLVWVIKEEADESLSPLRLSRIAAVIRAADDYDHVIATHLRPTLDFGTLADDPNIDQFALQWIAPTADSVHRSMVTAWENAAGRYNVGMAELAGHFTADRTLVRQKSWASAMAGAFVLVYEWEIATTPRAQLEDCGRLVGFFESVDLSGMGPQDELAAGSTEWVLARPGFQYLAYSRNASGEMGLQGLVAGRYDLVWYDPVTGERVEETGLDVPAGTSTWPRPASIGTEVALAATWRAPSSSHVWPTDGWTQASPADVGMRADKLAQARDYAVQTNGGGGAGFVTRHGRLVMAWGDTRQSWELKSVTKSIGTTLLGLAIKDGLVRLSDSAQQHHPDVGVPPASNAETGWLDDIHVVHLATHTAGFGRSGGYEEISFAPGTAFSYSDSGVNWLAEVVTLAYGRDMLDLLTDRIMSPLGVPGSDYTWRTNIYRDPQINGIPRREFGSGVSTNVDALARLGYLYLRGGTWDGVEILPPGFVSLASTVVRGVEGVPALQTAYPEGSNHYGLLWWNNADGSMPSVPRDTYFAFGLNEGLIVVIPSLDIVGTRLGNPWTPDPEAPHYPVVEPFITAIVEAVTNP